MTSVIDSEPMKSQYYQILLAVTAIASFYTAIPQYLQPDRGILFLHDPKDWVMAFCVLSLPVMIKRITSSNVLKSPAVVWCFLYALLTVLWFFHSSQSESTWQEVRWRVLAMTLFVTGLIVFWHPAVTRFARRALVAAVLLGVAFNIYELFVPMSFSVALGRSAGLYENPNLSGEALVLGMILSVTVLAPRYRAPFILLAGIGIILTVSRASIGTWIIAVIGFTLGRSVRPKDLLLSIGIGCVLVMLALLPRMDQLVTTWERTGVMNRDVLERLTWFTDPSGVSDMSAWERRKVAQQAWDKIADHPFVGGGTGSFHDSYVLPHNQYLALMLDHGLVGAMIVPSLILAVTWGARGESRRVAVVYGCSLMVLSFFTHAILTYEYSLILLALMAAMAGTNQGDARTVTAGDVQPSLWHAGLSHGFPKETLNG